MRARGMKGPADSSRRRTWTAWTIGAVVFAVCSALAMLGVFEPLELKSGYFRFKLRGRRALHEDIAVVSISDEDEKIAGERFPWPREYFATMVETLGYHGARVIALDFFFAEEKTAAGDKALADSIARPPKAITAFYLGTGPAPAWEGKAEEPVKELAVRAVTKGDENLLEGAWTRWPMRSLCLPGQAGFINTPTELDGTVLRLPLVMKYRGYVFPSLVLAAACRHFGADVRDVKVKPGHELVLPAAAGEKVRIPIDSRGRMIVNYTAGQEELKERVLSFMLLLKAEMERQSGEKPCLDPGVLKGKTMLIASFVTASKDVCTTPLGKGFGVAVHANALSNILEGRFLRRFGVGTTVCVLALCAALMVAFGRRRSLAAATAGSVVLLGGYVGLAYALFVRYSVWVDVVAPAVEMVALYSAVVTCRVLAEQREKARIRSIFSRYLSAEAVEEVLRTPDDLVFDGEVKDVTVLISDIRGFTTMTEELGAVETVSMLNEYFDRMVEVIHKYGGAIDKFVGDEIVAVWGVPKEKASDPMMAARAAVEMRREMESLMKWRSERGLKTFSIGIGINTGEAKVGNIGARVHMDYTVIGDTINYAARLESLSKDYLSPECPTPILISRETYERVKEGVHAEPVGEIAVKGRSRAEMIYRLDGIREETDGES